MMPETVRLFRAEVEQFRFVCYRTKVPFLAVTARAPPKQNPVGGDRLSGGALFESEAGHLAKLELVVPFCVPDLVLTL